MHDFFEMNLNDIERVLKLYIDYYNSYGGYCWTEEKARKRLEQELSMMNSFSLIMKTEEHEKYYTKAGYKNAANFIIKVKWFKEEN